MDPSFLAALPDNIRQEVIAEQLRLQRLRQRSSTAGNDGNGDDASFTEVNPEFLAALPLNIQEEVSYLLNKNQINKMVTKCLIVFFKCYIFNLNICFINNRY